MARANCPVCGAAKATCGHTELVYPPIDLAAPATPPSPAEIAVRDERMARIEAARARRRKAMGAPPEHKAVLGPTEVK